MHMIQMLILIFKFKGKSKYLYNNTFVDSFHHFQTANACFLELQLLQKLADVLQYVSLQLFQNIFEPLKKNCATFSRKTCTLL